MFCLIYQSPAAPPPGPADGAKTCKRSATKKKTKRKRLSLFLHDSLVYNKIGLPVFIQREIQRSAPFFRA